jgi:hypothetical protein
MAPLCVYHLELSPLSMCHFARATCDRLNRISCLDVLNLQVNVPPSAVANATIWGNHSSTQYPDVTFAKVNGYKDVTEAVGDQAWLQVTTLNPETQILLPSQRSAATRLVEISVTRPSKTFVPSVVPKRSL